MFSTFCFRVFLISSLRGLFLGALLKWKLVIVRPDSGIRHTEPQSSDSEDEGPSDDDWDIIEDDV
jgi:hypothetical protein